MKVDYVFFRGVGYNVGERKLNDWNTLKELLLNPHPMDVTRKEYEELKSKSKEKMLAVDEERLREDWKREHAEDVKRLNDQKFKNGCILFAVLETNENGKASRASGKGVLESSGLIIDFDEWSELAEANWKAVLDGHEAVLTPTASNRKDAPRRRLWMPFARNVDPETRTAFMRVLCDKAGWGGIDKSCLTQKQMQAVPVYASDEEEFFKSQCSEYGGEFFDAEKYLDEEFPQWRTDVSSLPKHPEEKTAVKAPGVVTERRKSVLQVITCPVEKRGVVGAFNRLHSCSEMLGKYGFSVDGNRASKQGHSDGGVVIYPDDTVFSFYGNCELSDGRRHDAFDIYLIYENKSFKDAVGELERDKDIQIEILKQEFPGATRKEIELCESVKDESFEEVLRILTYDILVCKDRASDNDRKVLQFRKGEGWKEINVKDLQGRLTKMTKLLAVVRPELEKSCKKYYVNASTNTQLLNKIPFYEPIWRDRSLWDANPYLYACRDGVVDLRALIKKHFLKKDAVTGKDKSADLKEVWKRFFPGGDPYFDIDKDYVESLPFSMDLLLLDRHLNISSDLENAEKDKDFVNSFMKKAFPHADDRLKKSESARLGDREMIKYIRRYIGSSLLNCCSSDNVILWFYGKGGAGKSSFMRGVRALYGEYCGALDMNQFAVTTNISDAAPNPQLHACRDKRVILMSETTEKVLSPENINKLMGGEMSTRTHYEKENTIWRFKGRCLMDCNEMPRFSNSQNSGIKRRLRPIYFGVSHKDHPDASIGERFEKDVTVSQALFGWMVDGMTDWLENGCVTDYGINTAPAAVIEAYKEYERDTDYIKDFIENELDIGTEPDCFCTTDKLFDKFVRNYSESVPKDGFMRKLRKMLKESYDYGDKREPRKNGVRGLWGISMRRPLD